VRSMNWVTIIGVILIAIGTILTFIGQQISADRSNKEILDKSGKIEKLSEDNIQLNKEIAKLNKQTADYISGDSYCVAVFEKYNDGSDFVNISVTNEGNNPLYELTMSIHEIDENFKGKGKLHRNYEEALKFLKTELTVNLGILAPKRGKIVSSEYPFFKKQSRNYNISYTSRGGDFTQFYRAALVKGQWRTAIKVFKQNPDNPLYEKIDSEYPRSKNGEVTWQ
jgi:hypothetical protein